MSAAPARIAGIDGAGDRRRRRRRPLRRRPARRRGRSARGDAAVALVQLGVARPGAHRPGSSSPSPPAASPGTTLPSPRVIVLEDGATFAGEALAGSGTVGGELVFNTSMAGYQEIATDPSYCGQLVTYTFPMNGNYGADPDRDESGKAHARAIIARELTNYRFNRASRTTWLDWLAEHGVLAVSGVDTRALTRHIREKGALRAVVSTETRDAQAPAQGRPGLAEDGRPRPGAGSSPARRPTRRRRPPGRRRRTCTSSPTTTASSARCSATSPSAASASPSCRPRRAPARSSSASPDGVFLSNGPGDPAAVGYAVKAVERLLGKVPVFGICLGHQLLAQALGMSTYKLKFGHRGANHPVKDLRTGVIEITTQNHGFAVRRGRRRSRRRDHARQPQRRHGGGRGGPERCTPSRCSTTPSPRPGRTTRSTCSTASATRSRASTREVA